MDRGRLGIEKKALALNNAQVVGFRKVRLAASGRCNRGRGVQKGDAAARPREQDDGLPPGHKSNTRKRTFFFSPNPRNAVYKQDRVRALLRLSKKKRKENDALAPIPWPVDRTVLTSSLSFWWLVSAFCVVHRTWALGGIAAGVASTTAVVLGAAWTSADPSFGNAIARAASKVVWPLVIIAGGWRLSLLEALRPAGLLPSAIGGIGQQALHWTKGVVSFAATFVALYAVGGLAARALYIAMCTPPQPLDAHAHEDVAFCRRSTEVMSAVVWPFQVVVAGCMRRASGSLDQTAQ